MTFTRTRSWRQTVLCNRIKSMSSKKKVRRNCFPAEDPHLTEYCFSLCVTMQQCVRRGFQLAVKLTGFCSEHVQARLPLLGFQASHLVTLSCTKIHPEGRVSIKSMSAQEYRNACFTCIIQLSADLSLNTQFNYSRGSTGSLSKARTPKAHWWTR